MTRGNPGDVWRGERKWQEIGLDVYMEDAFLESLKHSDDEQI